MAYETIYTTSAENVDIEKSSIKVTGYQRNPDSKYKTVGTDKLAVTVVDEQASDTRITFKLKEVNKTSQYVYGEVYILSYDASGNIIDLNNGSIYLDKKETKTTPEFYVSKSSHPNFDHYEIVYSGYYTTK